MICAELLAGCAINVGSLSPDSHIAVPVKLSDPLPKINDPIRLVKQERALSRWLILYQKTIRNW